MGNAAAAAGDTYGIKKRQPVLDYIYGGPASYQIALQRAIDALSDNPRPHGYDALDDVAPGLSQLRVEPPKPPHLLTYKIDDERLLVIVVSISQIRFQG